jgi:hypothetical protein
MHVVKPIDPGRLASVIASLQERRLGELAKETLDAGPRRRPSADP